MKNRHFVLQKGFYIYVFLFLFAIIFSQSLRNPISGVLLLFMFLLPIVSLIITNIGKSVIQVYVSCDAARCEKHTKVGYEIRVINQSPLSYPFVEAVITQPREDGVRCQKKKIFLALAPFGGYIINKEVSFCYRGLYEIGVSELYISDMLRMFRFKVEVDNYSNVLVYPRYLNINAKERHAYTELPSTHAPIKANEIAEAANIREYRMGDSQKSVHWKLSSKTEELQVKDYSINRDKNIYIFADLAAPAQPPEAEKTSPAADLIKLLTEKEKKKIRLKSKKKELSHADKAAAKISGKLSFFSKLFKNRQIEDKKERGRKKGLDEDTLSTVELIDRFIEETSDLERKKARAEKAARKNAKAKERDEKMAEISTQVEAEAELEADITKKLIESIDERSDIHISEEEISFGGTVLPEYTEDMAEFCADGIVEIALSQARHELNLGNKVTLAWYDSREDNGFYSIDIFGRDELDYAFERFSGAPVADSEQKIAELTKIIDSATNVSIKFVTANIDPYSISDICDVPATFGGAGSGCSCEVLLFNPEGRYTDPTARLEYAQGAKERFISAGIHMTEFKYFDGSLVSLDF